MPERTYHYSLIMTKMYPPDVRFFVSKIVPILSDLYAYPPTFIKKPFFKQFYWGQLYPRFEEATIGQAEGPHILVERCVHGEAQFSDEWEHSIMELYQYHPPYIHHNIRLIVESEDSLLEHEGQFNYALKVQLECDSLIFYKRFLGVMEKLQKKYKKADFKIEQSAL